MQDLQTSSRSSSTSALTRCSWASAKMSSASSSCSLLTLAVFLSDARKAWLGRGLDLGVALDRLTSRPSSSPLSVLLMALKPRLRFGVTGGVFSLPSVSALALLFLGVFFGEPAAEEAAAEGAASPRSMEILSLL